MAAADSKRKYKDTEAVVVRMPGTLLQEVDDAVASAPIPAPRNHWFLEAIHEKLTRAEKKKTSRLP